MEWLLAHANDPEGVAEPAAASAVLEQTSEIKPEDEETKNNEASSSTEQQAHSLKCDE
jgi:hypothetical protein